MKVNKKGMLVAAVTLLLAATLFVGAAAAADSVKYWTDSDIIAAVDANPDNHYAITTGTDGKVTVEVKTPAGLGWVASKILSNDSSLGTGVTIKFTAAEYDMDKYTGDTQPRYFPPLSSHQFIDGEKGAPINAMSGVKFIGNGNGANIKNLHIRDVLEYYSEQTSGLKNIYGSGFIGVAYSINSSTDGITFDNLTFTNVKVLPENPVIAGKSYNQIGGIVGYANVPVTFNKVTVSGGDVKGASKVGAFVGHAQDGVVTFKECKVSGTNLAGLDSVAGLVGYADGTSTVKVDPATKIEGVTLKTEIYPSDRLSKEVLAVIFSDGTSANLWDSAAQSKFVPIPAGKTVIGVVKGGVNADGTVTDDTKIYTVKSQVYNDALNDAGYGTQKVNLYGKEQTIKVRSVPDAASTETPTQTGKTPVPFIGILAGLGAAAVLVLRRK